MLERLANSLKRCRELTKLRATEARLGPRWVYVIECNTRFESFFKVGVAKTMSMRLATLQTGCPLRLKLFDKWKSPFAVKAERRLHFDLRQYRHRGEWFAVSKETMRRLIEEHKTKVFA